MSAKIDDEWQGEGEEGSSSTMEQLGHKMYDKGSLEYHTEITSPDAMSTADTVTLGLIADEFAGTGFDKDIKTFLNRKRVNYVAKNRARAGETERMVEATAKARDEGRIGRLLGSLER